MTEVEGEITFTEPAYGEDAVLPYMIKYLTFTKIRKLCTP